MNTTQTSSHPVQGALSPAGVVVVDAPIALDEAVGLRTTLRAISELTKPRITRRVTITSGVGFVMGAV